MEPFVGQLQAFAFDFAPRGWLKCDGQLLPISQHTSLYSLLGTTYGGDGRTTFGLPDLRGRVSMHQGNGPGLTSYRLGQKGGSEKVTLSTNEIPSHHHLLKVTSGAVGSKPVNGNLGNANIYSNVAVDNSLGTSSISETGGGQPHENRAPYLIINWCIATVGLYPSRT